MRAPRSETLALLLILASALALRLPGTGWGLPPAIPHVVASDIRSSYAFDEDDVLTYVSFTQPSKLDFDVRLYHWGTLHLEMTLLWLEAAEALGAFGGSWRQAYYQMTPGAFERVYVAGRVLSILMGLISILFVYRLGKEIESATAGLWGAAIVAASPAHLLASLQIRVDLTMMALLALTAWLGVRAQKQWRPGLLVAVGLAGGLAVTAKYPAVLVVLPLLIVVLVTSRLRVRTATFLLLGAILGCLAGQPYVLTRLPAMVRQVQELFAGQTGAQFQLPAVELLKRAASNSARFLIGPVALVAAAAGLWKLTRRHGRADWLILAALAGAIVSLIPLRWPLLRYLIPLLPFLAVTAGIAIASLPRRQPWLVGCAALAFPACASVAQLRYITSPHPANQILAVLLRSVPSGTPVSRLMAELPPLNRKVYPMGPNCFLDDLSRRPPAWVLTADLPDQDYPAETRRLLKDRYDKISEARLPRILPWATLGESGAPHDWKYTHPCMALYRRRS